MIDKLTDVSHIETIVTEVTGYNIQSKTRSRKVVEARAIYYYLCKKYTNYSLKDIGSTVGKDHATVIHGLKAINDWMELYPDYKKRLEACDLKLKYVYKVIDDKEQTVEEALSNLLTLEEENKKLLHTNIELLSKIQDMEQKQKEQDRYLIEAGYKAGMSRLGMKYNKNGI